MKRVLLLIIDQLAGHWVEGVRAPSTGLAPPNVMDYVAAGLLPNFQTAINEGLWVRRPMNRGVCMTPYGLRYIVSGRYDTRSIRFDKDNWTFTFVGEHPTFLTTLGGPLSGSGKPTVKVGSFGSACWVSQGWLASPYYHVGLPGYLDDRSEMEDFAFPWMRANPDWGCCLIYLPQHDNFKPGTPIWRRHPRRYNDDKHHHLTDYVDGYVGRVMSFLEEQGWWKDTLVIITSDHAYHSGCDACRVPPEKTEDPAFRHNHVFDHGAPYNCHVWDVGTNAPSRARSDCCRRITLILTGGGLPDRLRGATRETAEITDVAPTAAGFLGAAFACEGRDLLKGCPGERNSTAFPV